MFDIKDVLITKTSRKSIALFIHSNGKIEVRAPKYLPQFAINAFINSRKKWIEERLNSMPKHKTYVKKFENGEKFLFLGVEYSLLIGNFVAISVKDGAMQFPLGIVRHGKIALEKWYIKQAKLIIKAMVEEYAVAMGTSYESVSFSDTKSKWGSCTHDNRLQFNWRLILAPQIVVRYVVIHELAHTTNKNHSAIFWNKVRTHNPSYKNQIKWLKLHGDELQNY